MTTPANPDLAVQQPAADSHAEFVGRAFLRQIADNFLRVQNRILLLVAPPGIGKTAFVQALERDHAGDARPFIAHYCAEGDGANPDVFCEQLSAHLHALMGEEFALPTSARRQEVRIATTVTTGSVASGANVSGLSLNIGTAHPREAFRLLVREPLRAYNDAIGAKRDQQPLVILIDALDAAWEWDSGQGSSIVDILSDAQDLPAWVSVICTARPGPAVQALQARAGVQIVPINPTSPENLADIALYLRECFLGQLDADNHATLEKALHANSSDADSPFDDFVERVVAASQGNFLFIRRYVDALRDAFDPTRVADLAAMVQVDHSPASLQAALDSGYAQAFLGVQPVIDRNTDDADEAVLWALAISYAPLTVAIINRITARSESEIENALRRLTPLLDPNELTAGRYSFFHAGFADFFRRVHLGEKVRELNLRAAQALSDSDADAHVREYSRLHRWNHLRRSLRLTWPSNPAGSHVLPDSAPDEQMLMISPAEVQRQVPQPSMQAQALRGLASQALAPELADVPGSWTRALDYLQTAERTLRRSRALRRRRQPRYAAAPPGEMIELEKTLTAIGDAYVLIGQRMDPYIPTRSRPNGILQFLHVIWDSFARLPLTLFLLLVLIIQGTKELRIHGALQNLGRGQDWTVARQYVLAVSAYRRARAMASARDDGAAVDDISERLARLYALMGAFDAAAAGYSELMARPTALARQWHQAIWRLELGEVLLSGNRSDQAVDMFSSARLMFETQETNVQLARTLGGLARGHYRQASAADSAGDTVAATNLYNSSLAESAQALDTWQRVTTLRSADLGQIDPQIGISGVCHKLWEASTDPNLDVEQQLRARAILDRIEERHFPQRFEHPLLRLFRIGMAILLPLYLIAGLLLAVQLPNHIQVQTTTDLNFTAPELNLATFPDSIVSGRATTPGRLTEANLSSLTSKGVQLEAGNNWVSLESLATTTRLRSITGDVIYAILIYYFSYLFVGLGIIFLASPDRFQINRPGRLVLTSTTLEWRGRPSENPLLAMLRWLVSEAKALWHSHPRSQQFDALAKFSQRKLETLVLGASATEPVLPTKALPLDQIGAIISSDLHFFGSMIYDFSYTVVRPKDPQYPEMILEGRLVYYRELASELRARVCPQPDMERAEAASHHSFSIEVVRSRIGMIFCATVIYAAAMLVLLRLSPENTRQPIPFIDYSLSSLYVLITPGLLVPLLWWFVFKPMGVFQSRSLIRFPLLIATAIGALITMVVLYNRFSLVRYGLKPDLASPTFAAGVLMAVAWYARPRRHIAPPLARPMIALRTLLSIAAVAGLMLLLFHLGITIAWYDSVVRGNTSFARAAYEEACDTGTCSLLENAGRFYQNAIVLDSNAGDGYALRGLISLSTNQLDQAINDFQQAADTSPNTEQRATQYANIATTYMLLARDMSDADTQAETYVQAQNNIAAALALIDPRFANAAADCVGLTSRLLPDDAGTPPVMRTPQPLPDLTTRQIISQLGDVCINIGLARVASLDGTLDVIRNPEANQAWQEIASAVVAFRAVAASPGDPNEQYEARKGAAGAWLQLAQFTSSPADMPDRRTAALMALRTYQEIGQQTVLPEPVIAAGTAWSAIQLGAWDIATDDPNTPSLATATAATDAATYPAIHGLIKWFDSTQYPASSRITPSPAYTAAINEAITLYDEAILRSEAMLARDEADVTAESERLDHAYAIRSMLYYGLRNSQRGDTYQDEDYSDRMQQSLRDMDMAIAEATSIDRTPEEMAGLLYWRGRLAMALADTWQQELRGAHDWNELVPLLSRAYADFSEATAGDTNEERRKRYEAFWVPWSKALLNDASHFALARAALRDGDATTAERELALIEPHDVQKYNKESSAVPDYSFLYAAVRLARGSDLSFANVFIADDTQAYDALASVTQGIADTESGEYILKASADNPFESRPHIYHPALDDLDTILTTKNLLLAEQERSHAEYARSMITRALAMVAP